MPALTPEQRRTLLCRAMLIYQDAKFAVRPMAGVCERHIPQVRSAIRHAMTKPGIDPRDAVEIATRLHAVSERLNAARVEAQAMITDVCDTMRTDQLAMAAALKHDALLPSALKISVGQVAAPMSSIMQAVQEALVDLIRSGDVSPRTVEQHRQLVPILKEAGGTLLKHVSSASWAAQSCSVAIPLTTRENGVAPVAAPMVSPPRSAPAIKPAVPSLNVPVKPAAAPGDHGAPESGDTSSSAPGRYHTPTGQVDVAAYFERRRKRLEEKDAGA